MSASPIPFAIPGLGGVNLLRDPREIRDDELVLAQNVVPVKPGRLGTRPAIGKLAEVSTLAGAPIAGAFPNFLSDIGFVYVVNDGGEFVFSTSQLGSSAFSNTTFARSENSYSQKPVVFAWNGKIYCFTGTKITPTSSTAQTGIGIFFSTGTPPSSVASFKSGNTFAASLVLAGTGNEGIYPRVVAPYRSRLVYANFGPGFENYIVFSDDFKPDTVGNSVLAANGRNMILGGARDGDRIVAMVEVMLTSTGSPNESALLVLKEYSAYFITGQPNQTGGSGDPFGTMEVKRVSFDCGCSSAESVASTPYGTFWAGWDDVWFFAAGSVPVRVGSKIRPRLLETPAAQRYLWHGAYFDGFYRLAVFTPGQEPHDADFAGIPMPCGEQWWLDLRDGPPKGDSGGAEAHEDAKWWGPQIHLMTDLSGVVRYTGSRNFIVDTRPGSNKELYGLEFAMSALDRYTVTNGLGQVLITYGQNNARDLSNGIIYSANVFQNGTAYNVGDMCIPVAANGHVYIVTVAGTSQSVGNPTFPTTPGATVVSGGVTFMELDSGPTPIEAQGVEILPLIVSKEYDLGEPTLDKLVMSLMLNVWTSETHRLYAQYIYNGGFYTYTSHQEVMSLSHFHLGDQSPQQAASKRSQGIVLWPSPIAADVAITFQFSIYGLAGYEVTDDNSTFNFTWNGDSYTAELQESFYTDIQLFCDALVNAMNEAVGSVEFEHNQAPTRGAYVAIHATTHTWAADYDVVPPLVGAQEQPTRKILSILGFDASVAQTPSVTQTAVSTVFNVNNVIWEFSGIKATAEIIPREPS